MNVKMRILDYKREREAFCNPVVEWTFAFYVGNRCSGVRGQEGYKSIDAAYDAGIRMAKKLGLEVEE